MQDGTAGHAAAAAAASSAVPADLLPPPSLPQQQQQQSIPAASDGSACQWDTEETADSAVQLSAGNPKEPHLLGGAPERPTSLGSSGSNSDNVTNNTFDFKVPHSNSADAGRDLHDGGVHPVTPTSCCNSVTKSPSQVSSPSFSSLLAWSPTHVHSKRHWCGMQPVYVTPRKSKMRQDN